MRNVVLSDYEEGAYGKKKPPEGGFNVGLERRPQYPFGILSLVSQAPRPGGLLRPHPLLRCRAFRPIGWHIVFRRCKYSLHTWFTSIYANFYIIRRESERPMVSGRITKFRDVPWRNFASGSCPNPHLASRWNDRLRRTPHPDSSWPLVFNNGEKYPRIRVGKIRTVWKCLLH